MLRTPSIPAARHTGEAELCAASSSQEGWAGQEFPSGPGLPAWQGSPGVPYLALAGADVVERHGAVASSHGDAVAALVVTHHVEPEGGGETKTRQGKQGEIELIWNSTRNYRRAGAEICFQNPLAAGLTRGVPQKPPVVEMLSWDLSRFISLGTWDNQHSRDGHGCISFVLSTVQRLSAHPTP